MSPAPEDPHRAAPGRVLFACTHNATRSPMAEALLRQAAEEAGARVDVVSAGVFAMTPLDPMAARVMDEIGLDIRRHRPLSFVDVEANGGDLGAFDVIVALSAEAARETERQLGPSDALERWSVEDPTRVDGAEADRLDAYRAVRDTLRARISRRFAPRAA